jgi:hypothetical protein
MGRNLIATELKRRQARENIRNLQAQRWRERIAERETLQYAAQNYLRKTGKQLGAQQRYQDLSEGSEFVVLNNKPSKHANKQAAAITDKPVRVFNAQSAKFSHTVNAYKDLQGMYHFDFRDDEAMPTKHVVLTQNELEMMTSMIVADMNYTELLAIMEQLENG